MSGPTFVDGIGPPLEQIAADCRDALARGKDPALRRALLDMLTLIAEVKHLRANQRTGRIVHGDAEPFRCGAAYGSANRCSSQCSRCKLEFGA